ncbi:MAG: radical SAM protein [Desulfurococcaceae archaeon]
MDKIKFLVIDALARASGSRYATHDVVGAGPRIVAGIIEHYGYNVDLKAYELFIENEVDLREYDAILVSIMSSDKGALEKILFKLNKYNYTGLVIVGGPASFEYEVLLREFKRIDYVVVGEGEIPLIKILEKPNVLIDRNPDELFNIPALAYRTSKGIVLTTNRIHTPIDLLNSIKPWIRIDESYRFHKALRYYVEVLRGCSNYARPLIKGIDSLNCIDCLTCRSGDFGKRLYCPVDIPPGCGFCSVPYMFGPPRSRSIDSIVEEVVELVKHGARRIVLSAPDFLDYGREYFVKPNPLTDPCKPPANVEIIERLLDELTSKSICRDNNVVISVENIKACLVDEEVARVLGKYLKNTTIHIGLETGCNWYNDYVLGKPITVEQVLNAIKLLVRNGLRPYIYLMYGLPFANRKVYSDTVEFVKKLSKMGVEKITLYKYVNLPGTAFQKIKPCIDEYRDQIIYLKKIVNRFNLEAKKKFLNKEIDVYLVYSKGKYYGYPVKHGPVVFVKGVNKSDYSNCRAIVRITEISERFLWGRLISIVNC